MFSLVKRIKKQPKTVTFDLPCEPNPANQEQQPNPYFDSYETKVKYIQSPVIAEPMRFVSEEQEDEEPRVIGAWILNDDLNSSIKIVQGPVDAGPLEFLNEQQLTDLVSTMPDYDYAAYMDQNALDSEGEGEEEKIIQPATVAEDSSDESQESANENDDEETTHNESSECSRLDMNECVNCDETDRSLTLGKPQLRPALIKSKRHEVLFIVDPVSRAITRIDLPKIGEFCMNNGIRTPFVAPSETKHYRVKMPIEHRTVELNEYDEQTFYRNNDNHVDFLKTVVTHVNRNHVHRQRVVTNENNYHTYVTRNLIRVNDIHKPMVENVQGEKRIINEARQMINRVEKPTCVTLPSDEETVERAENESYDDTLNATVNDDVLERTIDNNDTQNENESESEEQQAN